MYDGTLFLNNTCDLDGQEWLKKIKIFPFKIFDSRQIAECNRTYLMVKLSFYVIHIVLLNFIVSRLTSPFGEYGAIKRYY